MWTRTRHFSDPEGAKIPHIVTACEPWHDGAGHFLTFYLCKDYWSLMNPLKDRPNPPPRGHLSQPSQGLDEGVLPRQKPPGSRPHSI